jgi:agmatine deiminase
MTSRPSDDGFFMPAEWHPHTRTWMSWPVEESVVAEPDVAFRAWSQVANTIVRYEPLTMMADPSQVESAAKWLDPAVEILEQPLDDSWMRDSGATFLIDGAGGLAGADWTFNGWGTGLADFANDDLIAARAIEAAGGLRYRSSLVNEGGGIHVDGEGTVLLTETVQLHDGRNPTWTKAEVEAELAAYVGAKKAIWFPRGLTSDYGGYGTNGHVDLLASFVRPGVVLCHVQPDSSHPDYEITKENLAILRASTDARGRQLEVIEVLAPTVLEAHGKPVEYSYINHYLANGLTLLSGFDDPRDADAAELFGKLFADRTVEFVDARPIFGYGGGIHCITQQEPRR